MASKQSIIDTNNVVTTEELYKIISAQLDEIERDPSSVSEMAPLFVHGSPGCGKSSIVRQICLDRGIDFIDFRASQCEPCDIRGLPVPNRDDKCMDWYVNGIWPRDPNGRGVIFLDELTSADRSIQVSLYQLVLDRNLGKLYSVPPGYLIIAAGNNTTDRAVATTMSSALANRFMHVELQEDSECWLTWARNVDIHPAVTGFIKFRPSMLFHMENENLERGWPTPRAWARVSKLCHMYGTSNEILLRKLVYGTVGNGAGVEFMEFYKINAEFDDILEMMTNPDKDVVIPKTVDRLHAMCSAMVYLLWRGKTDADENARIAGFYRICTELSTDFATMTMLAAISTSDKTLAKIRAGKMLRHPAFPAWHKKHGRGLRENFNFAK